MTTPLPMPDGGKITNLLSVLFDGLAVKAGGEFDQTTAGGSWYGVFIGASGEPAALCGADVNLAAIFGAALSMLPVAAAKDAAKSRELSGVMIDNMREVMNICSRLVMDSTSPHLKLEQIYPRQSLPAAAAGLLATPKAKSVFQVTVPKYGQGAMSFMTI